MLYYKHVYIISGTNDLSSILLFDLWSSPMLYYKHVYIISGTNDLSSILLFDLWSSPSMETVSKSKEDYG